MKQLLDAVRKASLPAMWSQGVKLAREQAVTVQGRGKGELTLRVKGAGQGVAPTVTLYTSDLEWSCDCGSRVDPCAHVVAAAIASAASASTTTEGAAEPPKAPAAKLVYRLATKNKLLTVQRFIVHADGREDRMGGGLSPDMAKGKLPITPTHEDIRVDRMLGSPARELVPIDRIGVLLSAISSDAEVTFEGAPVQTSGEPILPSARVEDGPGGGFVLRIEKDPAIEAVVAKGVARVAGVLHPLGEIATTGDLLDRLPLLRTFPATSTTELVTQILPELEKKLTVTVATKKLPRPRPDAKPRIAMDLSHHGHTLSILPTLVYGEPPIARVDGERLVQLGADIPIRRPSEEREWIHLLRDELHLVPGRRVDFDGVEAIRFAAKLRAFQERHGHASPVFEQRELVPRLITDNGTFDVLFEFEGEDGAPRHADAATVMRAFRDGLDLVPLEGGGWAPLPTNWLEKHGFRVADLLAARGADKKLTTAALPELGALCEELEAPKPMGLDKLAPLLHDFVGIPQVALPKGLNADLRSYQRTGVDWLSFLKNAELGAVLADDMGLGKTLQTICVLSGRTLVVCPKSVVHNWAAEIERFRPGLRTEIYHGARRELDENADVTLTTYAMLRLDTSALADIDWDIVVLDEAQAIKNPGSQTARAAFALSGAFRIALSGTPVENRLEELWSLMHFANPGLLGGRSDFDERYASPISTGNREAAQRLRAKIRPFVLRRMKRDVLPELPPRTEAVLHVELDETERSVYDAVRVATKKEVAEKLSQGGSVLAALEALLRLRQASCHPQLVPGQSATTSSKVERLLEALEEVVADGHKALVFSQWTGLLDLVEPHLDNAKIAFTRLDGSTRDRATVVNTFQSANGPPVMLVSLKAGGTGLNLTAADHVFLLDPWWNPAVEDQAADRAHRIGQDRPVIVYRLVAKDTVEERIFALQGRKRALADVALGEAEHAAGITRAELLALLE
ncbi:MAG: DEAD/DEAH box helicase [Polyangiaceae bacterium]|nr:DEAD/DEAH box helicase [Polyangiaceae bacterium]